jgi:hypothetical protein
MADDLDVKDEHHDGHEDGVDDEVFYSVLFKFYSVRTAWRITAPSSDFTLCSTLNALC